MAVFSRWRSSTLRRMVPAALLLVRQSFIERGNRWLTAAWLVAASVIAEPLSAQASEPGAGVGVVLWGPVSESSSQLCKQVARSVYAEERLAPRVDEASVRALCGAEDVSESSAAVSLRDLRAALNSPVDGPATQVLLAAIAVQTDTRALLLVRVVEPAVANASTTAEVLVVHRKPEGAGGPATFVDPMRFELAFPLSEAFPSELAQAARELVFSPPCSRADEGELSAGLSCQLAENTPQVLLAPFEWWAPIPESPAGKTGLIDSPWFWIAAGGVAALGLTVLVVSQTTDVSEGTVRIEGTVPR